MLVDKCARLDVDWLYEILMFEVWRFIKMHGLKHRKPIHSGLFWKEHVEGKIVFISDRNALNGHWTFSRKCSGNERQALNPHKVVETH